MDDGLQPVLVLASLGALFFVGLYFGSSLGAWILATMGGVPVGLFRLARARTRGVSPRKLVEACLLADRGGVQVSPDDIESLLASNGNAHRAVAATIGAQAVDVPYGFRRAMAAELSGRDSLREVNALVRKRDEGDLAKAEQATAEEVAALAGYRGQVKHAVGPPGIVEIDGRLYGAITEDGYADKHAPVRVCGAKGNLLVVREMAGEEERS